MGARCGGDGYEVTHLDDGRVVVWTDVGRLVVGRTKEEPGREPQLPAPAPSPSLPWPRCGLTV